MTEPTQDSTSATPGTGQTGATAPPGQPPVTVVFQQPGQPAPGAAQTPGQENWEARFKGLSKTHQELSQAHKDAEALATQAQAALQQQLEQAQAQVAHLTQQGTEATATVEDMQLQMAVMEANQAKLSLLTQSHPDLVPFHAYIPHVGPDGTIQDEEGLKAAIEGFATLMASKTEGAIQQFREGHVPSPPGAAGKDGDLDADARAALLEQTLGVKGREQEGRDHLTAWRTQHTGT